VRSRVVTRRAQRIPHIRLDFGDSRQKGGSGPRRTPAGSVTDLASLERYFHFRPAIRPQQRSEVRYRRCPDLRGPRRRRWTPSDLAEQLRDRISEQPSEACAYLQGALRLSTDCHRGRCSVSQLEGLGCAEELT
jgi:hypothetical protein